MDDDEFLGLSPKDHMSLSIYTEKIKIMTVNVTALLLYNVRGLR